MSDYYNSGSAPSNSSFGSSAVIRAEFDAIETNISDKLPALTGAANKIVVVNPSATALTTTTLDKNAVGLGNVDNTSDANKPVSTAAIAANDAQNTVIAGKALLNNVAPDTNAAANKATPVAADKFPLADSAASFTLKHVTLTQLATALGIGAAPAIVDISNASATIAWNVTTAPYAKITPDGNKTITLAGLQVGWATLVVTQTSPARTITLDAAFKNFGVGSGFAPDFGTVAGYKTVISGFYDGVEFLVGNSPKHY